MRSYVRLLLTALVASLALSIAVGSASAGRSIEVRNAGGGVSATSRLTLRGERAESLQVICDITLLRTISTLIPKITGVLIGGVTGIKIEQTSCRNSLGGGANVIPLGAREDGRRLQWTVNSSPLWKLIFLTFAGTLPDVTRIDFAIEGTQFNLLVRSIVTVECLYQGRAFGEIELSARRVVRARASATTRLPLIRGGELCPRNGSFQGTFAVTPANIEIALL